MYSMSLLEKWLTTAASNGQVDGDSVVESSDGNQGSFNDRGKLSDLWSVDGSGGLEVRLQSVSAEKFFRDIGNLYATSTRGFYLVSQCFVPRNREDVESFLEAVQSKKRDYPIKFVIQHGRHFHVIHSCKWVSRACDCFGRKLRARKGGRPPRINDLKERDWINLFNYHLAEGRILTYFKSGREEATSQYVQAQLLHGLLSGHWNEREGDVEACRFDHDDLYESFGSGIDHEGSEHSAAGGDKAGQASKRPRSDSETSSIGVHRRRRRNTRNASKTAKPDARITQKGVQQFMMRYCKVPLEGIIQSAPWIYGEYNEMNTDSVIFKNAMRNVKAIICEWPLREFKRHYETNTDALWGAFSKEQFDRRYLPLDESLQYLKLLMINQYAPDSMDANHNVIDTKWKPAVYGEVKTLIEFLDRTYGKQNTWYFLSEANAGKTLFTDLLRDYLITSGMIATWNRSNNFPLMMCVGARIIVWNEPEYEEHAQMDMLKLFGGDTINVKVKNTRDGIIQQTPVIVTSNHYKIPKGREFEVRRRLIRWRESPFLAPIKEKRLHPLSLGLLFEQCENYFEEDLRMYGAKY